MWQGLKQNEANLAHIFISVNFLFTIWCLQILLFNVSCHITKDSNKITKKAEIHFHSLQT